MADEPNAAVTTWLIDETAWGDDDETPGLVAMLVDSPTVQAGLWRPGPSGLGPFEVDLQHTEIVLVISGSARLEVNGGPPLELTRGRAARIEAGSHTRWTVEPDFAELWIYA
jgi:uncharacterized cupin superfamily protein